MAEEKKKILVVEDEGNMRTMLALELETSGYEVYQAEDGVVGLEVAQEKKPDLIISDILMPHMDGNELMKRLRATDFGRDIPFIVLTARGQMQDYFEVMEVDDFVVKPFDADDLLARVKRALHKSKKSSSQSKVASISNKKKILILDDDTDTQQDLQKALVDHGYEVNVTNTVSEFLETAVSFKPNLMALRFLLEEMNGDKLVGIVKGMTDFKDVPCIVYSNRILGWEESKVLSAGASSFVGDVDHDKILKAVNEIFA